MAGAAGSAAARRRSQPRSCSGGSAKEARRAKSATRSGDASHYQRWPLRGSKPLAESSAASIEDAPKADKKASVAIGESPAQLTVLVADSTPIPVLADPDDALRAAIKAAVDAGDLGRATALLEVLKATPKPAVVLTLATSGKR